MAQVAPRTDYKFDLFVSYSTDPDYGLVRRLESFLETFHRLRTPERLSLRPLHVCVDGSDFSHRRSRAEGASGSIPDVVEEHLKQSRQLLVLCSSRTRRSAWVDREVRWFLEHRGPDAIGLAVTEGADPGEHPEEHFPAAVLEAGLHRKIWYDLRESRGRRAKAWAKVRDLDDELTRLAADLNDASASEIRPLWYRQRLRSLRNRVAIGLAALALLVAAAGVAVYMGLIARQGQASRLIADAYEIRYRDPSRALLKAHAADQLNPTPVTKRAVQDAYVTAVLHAEDRREEAELRGVGAAELAGRYREGRLFSKIGRANGQHVLIATERGEGTARPPGDVYLQDNETLGTVKLESCFQAAKRARLEYLGFSGAGDRIFVVRQFYLSIYNIDGSCAGEFNFSRFTTSPVHYVGGYLEGGLILAGSSIGEVFLVDPRSGKRKPVKGGRRDDALLFAEISPSGRLAILVFESGRADALRIDGGKVTQRELGRSGVLSAAFAPSRDQETFATTGKAGMVRLWKATGDSFAETFARTHGDTWVRSATFSEESDRLVTIGDDATIRIWEVGTGKLLTALDQSDRIDWEARRRLPGGGRLVDLSDSFPAYGKEKAFPDPTLAVRGVVEAAGDVWLLTAGPKESTAGPAYRVRGRKLEPFPEEQSSVWQVVPGGADTAWLRAKDGVYLARGDRLVPVLEYEATFRNIRAVGDGVWLEAPQGLYRYRAGQLVRMAQAPLDISAVKSVAGRDWLLTNRGAYRVADDHIARMTDTRLAVDDVRSMAGGLWLLSSSDTGRLLDHPSQVHLLDGYNARPILDGATVVNDLREVDGKVLLATRAGAYRVEGTKAIPIGGCDRTVSRIKSINGEVWLLTGGGFWSGPAYRLRGDRATILRDESFSVTDVVAADGQTYVLTVRANPLFVGAQDSGPAYRVGDDGSLLPLPRPDASVSGIVAIGGDLWLRTFEGVYKVRGDSVRRFPDGPTSIAQIKAVGGDLYLATDRGAYRVDGDRAILLTPPGVKVWKIEEKGGRVWFFAGSIVDVHGLYYASGDRAIAVEGGGRGVREIAETKDHLWLLTGEASRPGPVIRLRRSDLARDD